MQPFETVYVDSVVVACDGPSFGGHPRVFLNLGSDGQVECPYCSRLFILRGKSKSTGGAAVSSSPQPTHP